MRSLTSSIREARTDEEKLAIFRFRYEIYIEEMGKPYPNADHAGKLLTDELDSIATLLYYEKDGEIHGTLRVNWGTDNLAFAAFDNPNFELTRFDRFDLKAFSFNSRFIISPKFRNSRVGLDLAKRSYQLGLERRVLFNFINCKTNLVKYFERFGFRQYKDVFLDEIIGEQAPMIFLLEDQEYLRQIRSPVLERTHNDGDSTISNKFEATFFI